MTIWITDFPDSAAPFTPSTLKWVPFQQSAATDEFAKIATLFNPGKFSWRAESGLKNELRVMVLIDEAESSQFDRMNDYVRQHPLLADGLICLALTGTNFRGQRQRPWTAMRGNLHLTAYYHLDVSAAAAQACIAMIPAIASAEAIAEASGNKLEPAIKWINDIWLNGQKVSGVLSSVQRSDMQINSVVFGIGINLEHAPDVVPTPFVPVAGCLAAACPELVGSLPDLFRIVVQRLDHAVDLLRQGWYGDICDKYRRYAGFIGQNVRIWPEGTEDWRNVPPAHQGRVLSMNQDLSLNLDSSDQPIRSGRMAYEESCRILSCPGVM